MRYVEEPPPVDAPRVIEPPLPETHYLPRPRPRPPGASLLDMNCYYANAFPFVYGALCTDPARVARSLPLFAVAVAFTIHLKRRSALRPGGRLHRRGRRMVRERLSDRKRRMRDLLNDPLLAGDMERRYGDLSSLRQSVERWELDGFAIQKKEEDDYIKAKGLPWITTMNIWLTVLFFLTLYLNFYTSTVFVLFMCLAHIVDNMLLQRAAVNRRGRVNIKSEVNRHLETAFEEEGPVSEPETEVDVGVPVEELVTV